MDQRPGTLQIFQGFEKCQRPHLTKTCSFFFIFCDPTLIIRTKIVNRKGFSSLHLKFCDFHLCRHQESRCLKSVVVSVWMREVLKYTLNFFQVAKATKMWHFCCCVCCASGNVFYERAVFTISGYFYSLRKKVLLCTTLQPWEVSPAKLFSFRSPPFTSTSIQVAANKLLGLLQTLWRFDREAVWLRISLLEEIGRQLFCNFHLLVRFSWFKEGKELIQRELV